MSVHQASNKTWYVSYRIGDKHTKKRGFPTKKAALEWQAEYVVKLKQEREQQSLTFATLYALYCENATNKEISLYKIKKEIEKNILPFFSNYSIYKITPLQCLDWKNTIDNSDFSLAYKQKLLAHLRRLFKFAVNFYNLPSDPTRKLPPFKKEAKKEMLFLTREQFDKFISTFDNDIVYRTFFNFLYFTGCRKGEALALTWQDIDNDIVHITKSWNEKLGGKITPPKTKNSVRDIFLPDVLIEQLNALKRYQMAYDGFSDKCFVFFLAHPLADNTIKRKKDYACKSNNLPIIRIHDFRHSHVSFLINNCGIDNILIISQRLGHANIEETLNTYSHLFPNKQRELLKYIK